MEEGEDRRRTLDVTLTFGRQVESLPPSLCRTHGMKVLRLNMFYIPLDQTPSFSIEN